MARQEWHRSQRESGGHGTALMLPFFALAEQQSVAEQRTQHPHGGRGTTVIVGVVDEDMMDPRGSVQNYLLAAEKAAVDRLLVKGLRRKSQYRVVAQRLGDDAAGERAGRRVRRRKHQWRHLGHSGGPLTTMRSRRDRDLRLAFQASVAAPGTAAEPASTGRPSRRR